MLQLPCPDDFIGYGFICPIIAWMRAHWGLDSLFIVLSAMDLRS
jgi:hypothetical protein